MDYGKTLHLPETEFPMRGNLPKREPEILKFWEDNKIYQKRLELRKDAKPFILKWHHWTCATNVRNMH